MARLLTCGSARQQWIDDLARRGSAQRDADRRWSLLSTYATTTAIASTTRSVSGYRREREGRNRLILRRRSSGEIVSAGSSISRTGGVMTGSAFAPTGSLDVASRDE